MKGEGRGGEGREDEKGREKMEPSSVKMGSGRGEGGKRRGG